MKSVAVIQGDAMLTRHRGNARAYWMVSLLSAAFDIGQASIVQRESGTVFRVSDPT